MTRLLAVLALVACSSCATPAGSWTFAGEAPAGWAAELPRHVAAARQATGDGRGNLRAGGKVYLYRTTADLAPVCLSSFVAGCSGVGAVHLLELGPELGATALDHELCHQGLERGGGPLAPVELSAEPATIACAGVVRRLVAGALP